MSSSLDDLENQLENFIENIRQIGILASEFNEEGQPAFNQKLQNMICNIQEIDKFSSCMQDVQVPLDVLDYIDTGKNPQIYTKDCLENSLCRNEEAKGKIDSYAKFKALLTLELSHEFPNEIMKYRAIRSHLISKKE